MCTLNDAESTRTVLSEMAAGRRVFWKVYLPARYGRRKVLKSSVWHAIISGPGIIDSGRKTTRATAEVSVAIHAFRDRTSANKFVMGDEVVVPVLCKPEDFIAADGDAAAFRKVRLTRSEWRKATKTIPNVCSARRHGPGQ